MKKLKIVIYILLISFLLISIYYFSLSLYSSLQIFNVSGESKQFLEYKGNNNKEYCYKKNIVFSAVRGLYQTQTARVYVCLNKSNNPTKIQSIYGKILRNSCEQVQEFKFNYSDLSEIVNSNDMLTEYIVYRVNSDVIRFYLGSNDIEAEIAGIKSDDPSQDIKIMVVNSNHKGTTIPVLFFIKAMENFLIVIILYIMIFIIKKYYSHPTNSDLLTGPSAESAASGIFATALPSRGPKRGQRRERM